MRRDNPFTLTFGKQPTEYIYRYENTHEIISTFDSKYPICQTYLIEGIRGSGKTVLMTAISKELSSSDDWLIVDLNSTQDLLQDFALRLSDICRKSPGFMQSGFQISLAGFGLGLGGEKDIQAPISVIETLLQDLGKKGKKVLITIDEVLPDANMRLFVSEFQLLLRKDYPVFLLMTGLYEHIHAVQNDPQLTFLLRTPKIRLEPLGIAQIARQYKNVFSISESESLKLATLTRGYAFAFQALGMLYYEHKDTLPLEEILDKLDDILEDFVYNKIWSSLSQTEKTILTALPEQEKKVEDVRRTLSMTSSTFSKYRDRLLKSGLILAPQYGFVQLALPRFSFFTKRMKLIR